MKTIPRSHVDVLILLNLADIPNGNVLGDAHVVTEDGSLAPANNIDAGEVYSVLHLTDAGLATPCEVVSVRRYDVHGPRGTAERLRVEVRPIADAEKVRVTP